MPVRFALASSAGLTVDQHFSRADVFYIYETMGGEARYVEKRVCRCPGGHTEESFSEKTKMLSDCSHIFVSRIGADVADRLIALGFRVFSTSVPVSVICKQMGDSKE